MENEHVNFDEIRNQIKPFDIISFKGADAVSSIISSFQKYFLGSDEVSHVGMVVTSEILPYYTINGAQKFLDSEEIYVFESTIPYNIGLNLEVSPDVLTGQGQMGVQIRKLKDVVLSYTKDGKSSVAWCKLIGNPFNDNNKDFLSIMFQEIFHEYYNRMYDLSFISLASAIFPKMRGIRAVRDFIYYNLYKLSNYLGFSSQESLGPLGWQFCSELMANIYIELGIIDPSTDPRNVVPVDFFGFDKDGLPRIAERPIYLMS